MKQIILCFIFLIVAVSNVYSTDIYEGSVSGSWTESASPYNIYGNLTIEHLETLNIEPGVEVIFQGKYYIDVQGQISALGELEHLVKFYPVDQSEGWLGIRFFETSSENDMSEFSYCEFSYGNVREEGTGADFRHGGAIYIKSYSEVLIKNCSFFENRAFSGGAIGLRYGSSPIIKNNYFTNNYAEGESSGWGGALVFAIDCNPKIIGNIFKGNSASGKNYAGGGALYFEDNCNPIIVNNLITNNTVTSSVGSGAAIYCHTSSGFLVNNTIYNNKSYYEEGITLVTSDIKIYNNIIWDNLPIYGGVGYNAEIRLKNESTPFLENNDIKSGIYGIGVDYGSYFQTYLNNIVLDPLFNSSEDFSLQEFSPCIDAGKVEIENFEFPEFDIAGNNRVLGSTIDIGAYESNYVSINPIAEEKQFVLLGNYPNPFNPITKINYELAITNYKLAEIVVYNSTGQQVWSSPITDHGLRVIGSILFDGSKFNSGVYYYSLIVDGKRLDTKSMILLK